MQIQEKIYKNKSINMNQHLYFRLIITFSILFTFAMCSQDKLSPKEEKIITQLNINCNEFELVQISTLDTIPLLNLDSIIAIKMVALLTSINYQKLYKKNTKQSEEAKLNAEIKRKKSTTKHLDWTYKNMITDMERLIASNQKEVDKLKSEENVLTFEIDSLEQLIKASKNKEPILISIKLKYLCDKIKKDTTIVVNSDFEIIERKKHKNDIE
jgi:hypothetical protein